MRIPCLGLTRFGSVGTGLLAVSMALIGIFVSGCVGSSVSYGKHDKCLIVKNNNAVLSWKNTVIGDERLIDTILLKKGSGHLVRVTYFNVSMDSRLSISEEDFRFDFANGRMSLCTTNNLSVLTNQYDRCVNEILTHAQDNRTEITIEGVHKGRVTYAGHRDAVHIIWLDAKLNNGKHVHFPLRIAGTAEKGTVVLTVEKREKCDYVIQENLYEFGVF